MKSVSRITGITLLVILFNSEVVWSQQLAADSIYKKIIALKANVKQQFPSDTLLLKSYVELARILISIDPDSAMACANVVISGFKQRNEDESEADPAMKRIVSNAYNQLGNIRNNLGNYDEAEANYRLALSIRLEINDRKGAANVYNNLGIIYKNKGNYDEAIFNHLEALKIRESIVDSAGIAASYNNIGSAYFVQGNFSEALKNYRQALKIRQQIGDRKEVAVTTNNIGNIFEQQSKYREALTNYFLALHTATEISDKRLMAECYNNIGNSYFKQGLTTEARKNFLSAFSIQESIGDKRGMVTAYKNLGWTFASEKKHEQVLEYLHKAMDLAKRINAKDQQMQLYRDYAELYSRIKKYNLAYENHILYTLLKDTILSAEKNQRIAELQTRYETEKKDKEIDLLNKDKALKTEQLKNEKTIRNTVIFGSVMAFLLIIILVNRYRVLTEQRKKTEKAEFERELHELQMKALRSQMNPHFIFNCLNSVQRYILKNDKTNAVEYLQKFSTLMRLILDNSEKNMVTLNDEIKMLDLYMHLEAQRLDQGMDIEMKVDSEIDEDNLKIPSMILQPFVENAIIHGLMHKEDKGKICIDISQAGNLLTCIIEDNGIGRDRAAEIKNRKSIKHVSKGLSITKARVDLLNQMNKSSNTIQVTDLKDPMGNPQGTRVEVTIPVG